MKGFNHKWNGTRLLLSEVACIWVVERLKS